MRMNTGSTFSLVLAVAVFVGIFAVLALKPVDSLPPIIDPTCEPGYVLVGEGCMTEQEACELQGDQYVFDESIPGCIPLE